MDFEQMLSNCKSRACVISVERYPDGTYGNIRIVAANKAHCADAEKAFQRKFVPNSPYYYYLPQDKNFEDFMYRSACLGQPLHTYVHLEQMGLWVNMFLMPLDSDEENLGYCFYYYDITPYVDREQQASLAADTASNTLEICIKLRGAERENKVEAFNEVIEDLRKQACAEYGCILLADDEKQEYAVFCESISPDGKISLRNFNDTESFHAVVDTIDTTINGSSCMIIKDENDMKWLETINPGLHSLFVEMGAGSVIIFPLNHNGRVMGYLWSMNFKTDDVVKIKETLELSTLFIASEIANYQLMNKLEILSSIDVMTGCNNRNAMNNMVNEIVAGKMRMTEPSAVVFADLNGLKHVNDESGHGAGDLLLRKAAVILQEAFPEGKVFRAGGDEFVVIAMGMDEETLETRRKKILERATAENLFFAIGTHVMHGNEDIRVAMRLADQGMYADKKEYYSNHPDRRFRQ